MDISTVRCQMCGDLGEWKNMDEYRYKASGMYMCTGCGFVTYPDVVANKDDLTEFYREEYREPPNSQNIYTGERKLHYHATFLKEVIDAWNKEKKKPSIFECGAAFGMFLDWMRQAVPGADVSGSELTYAYVRNAFYMYGIKLTDKIDESKKYDMITSYKVAEHIPDFDVELAKYFNCLKNDGLLYISVPTWFGCMNNFGAAGFQLEYYYHKNHVNVWTRKAFENLLARKGFEVIKEDHVMYDDTYLCKKNDGLKATPVFRDDPETIESKMKKIHSAAMAFDEGDYEKAISLWPDFPEAHRGRYEFARANNHKNGFDWIHDNIIVPAIKDCPVSPIIRADLAGDVCMRYSRWQQAIKYLDDALKMRPNDPAILLNISHCYRHLADEEKNPNESLRLLAEARKVAMYTQMVSQQAKPEALNWAMLDNSKIPTPWEIVKKKDASVEKHTA